MTNDSRPATYRILPELLRGNRATIAVVVVLALVAAAATLVLPIVSAALIVSLQKGDGAGWWGVAIVALGIGATIAGAASSYLLTRASQTMVLRLRMRTMQHAFRARLRDTARLGTGNLATRLTADASNIQAAAEVGPVHLPVSAVILLGTVVIMSVLDWVLLLIALASFALAFLGVGAVIVALRSRYALLQRAVGALSESFVNALDSLPVVKAYRAEELVLADLRRESEEVRDIELGLARYQSLLSPVLNLGQQIALVSVLIGGGVRLVAGDLSLAAFVAFLMYLLQLAAPLMTAVSGFATIQAGLAARDRYDEVFALEREDGDRPTGPVGAPAAPPEAAVVFSGVDFAYDEEPVLRSAGFTVPARGLTALVGVSGAGKSTVLGLIEGFISPAGGDIRILGRDRAEWPLAELRARLGYVDQRFTLIPGTVRANLTLGLTHSVDDGTLYRVLERVDLADTVRALPDGLGTRIGNGTDLSGGQRQRLALARMMLSDFALVLLDEPTSQLDSLSEGRLRGVVDDLSADRAVLVVAHRMSTVRHADHVVVMDGGVVIAEGTHTDLMHECAPYAALVAGQVLPSPEPSLV